MDGCVYKHLLTATDDGSKEHRHGYNSHRTAWLVTEILRLMDRKHEAWTLEDNFSSVRRPTRTARLSFLDLSRAGDCSRDR